MFLTLFDSSEKELKTLIFGSDGKAELIGIFTASKKSVRDFIVKDENLKALAERFGMKALDNVDNFDESIKETSVIDQVANSFKFSTKHIF